MRWGRGREEGGFSFYLMQKKKLRKDFYQKSLFAVISDFQFNMSFLLRRMKNIKEGSKGRMIGDSEGGGRRR